MSILGQPPDQGMSAQLLAWFDQNGRKNLPWQKDKTPYSVWLSEIMLQQTQVTTVIPYFEKFMLRFPTLDILAVTPEEEVLKYWAGLGYYARGRNLHKTARILAKQKQNLPDQLDALIALPGIGKSTAGAILSIAYKKRAVILDGNVKRVLTRIFAIKGWSGKKEVENKLWQLADRLTPENRFDDYTQAIMDLGATLCTRSQPKCGQCPWQDNCQAFKIAAVTEFPFKKPQKNRPIKTCWLLDIRNEKNESLLLKRPPAGIWGGLWSLPELDKHLTDQQIIDYCAEVFHLHCLLTKKISEFRHSFSHFHLDIHPVILKVKKSIRHNHIDSRQEKIWSQNFKKLGLPAPISRYLKSRILP